MSNQETIKAKILLVAANPSVSTTLGWPVGFWAAELTHPYYEFSEAGFEVEIASPDGGKIEMDSLSDPRDPSRYSSDDLISMGFIHTEEKMALLKNTKKVSECNVNEYSAMLVVGGQSPMFTFKNSESLQKKFLEFYKTGKPTAALCHGTALLLYLKNDDGSPFVKDKRITGFANSEEDFADKAVGQKVMPFRIEDEAKNLGANFVAGPMFLPHVEKEANLITGQQQNSGRAVAQSILQALS